jgi:hypothetical protein
LNDRHCKAAAALCAATLVLPATAAQFGDFELGGSVIDEWSLCDNCAPHQVNPNAFDPRGVLGTTPAVNQPGIPGRDQENLFLVILNAGVKHEFDNAVVVEGRLTTRQRNYHADIAGEQLEEAFAGVSYPTWGALKYGTMTSRSWSRADGFTFDVGLAPWAESGAGYGVLRHALRYTSPEFEPSFGKISFEATLSMPHKSFPLNPATTVYAPPPSPRLIETFIQFSNEGNLIELIYQHSSGGIQSSFAEGGFFGAAGNTDSAANAAGYQAPSENLWLLEGSHWIGEHWKFTYGLKRSWWSGLQQQCDYSASLNTCFYDQAGFNYAVGDRLHSAYEYDGLLAGSYTSGLWTYTAGAIRFNSAYTKSPTEWGQSNNAYIGNLEARRKLNINSHVDASVYGGVNRVQFSHQRPAPLGFPSNTAFGGVDPRVSKSGNTYVVGARINF